MSKDYNTRLNETRERSLAENTRLFNERSPNGKPTGVLERVIIEQMRSSARQEEGDYHDRGEYSSE